MANIFLERILEALQDKGSTPNTFTRYLGEQLKKAREEAGLSQSELAEMVYRRRPSISDIENGKMMPDIGTVVLLASALEKPVLYFIPNAYLSEIEQNSELTELEQELLFHFRNLSKEGRQLAVKQIITLVKHLKD